MMMTTCLILWMPSCRLACELPASTRLPASAIQADTATKTAVRRSLMRFYPSPSIETAERSVGSVHHLRTSAGTVHDRRRFQPDLRTAHYGSKQLALAS